MMPMQKLFLDAGVRLQLARELFYANAGVHLCELILFMMVGRYIGFIFLKWRGFQSGVLE